MSCRVCVIGAGPAGLFAAIHAARGGAPAVLIERNPNAGRKLLMTGGGRCNLTHEGDARSMVRAFGEQGRFLSYALHELSPDAVRAYFRDRGLDTVVDDAGCVFPSTHKAVDVRDLLLGEARGQGVPLRYGRRIRSVVKRAGGFVLEVGDETIEAQRVVVATGGLSRPETGSTGDGYRFAAELGHTVTAARPSLVRLVTRQHWCASLAGTALSNVTLVAQVASRRIRTSGALVFTHDGIGGPAALDLSRSLTDRLQGGGEAVDVSLDVVPTLDAPGLERSLLEDIGRHPKRSLVNLMAGHVPKRLAVHLCAAAGGDRQLQAGQLSKPVRRALVNSLKAITLTVVRTGPMAEATVTRGGVATDQIDPTTLESKLCPGLFFAGEVLDVDGPCGGYNLQMCWSTGLVAGRAGSS